MAENIVILITAPDTEVANRLARTLAESKKAACVNILPGLKSFYWWQGKLNHENEVLLLVKTRAELFDEVSKLVKSIHPYQVPEIIALPIVAGNQEYLKWISETTNET
jgi:periplasmic divalent cation tolerance protein